MYVYSDAIYRTRGKLRGEAVFHIFPGYSKTTGIDKAVRLGEHYLFLCTIRFAYRLRAVKKFVLGFFAYYKKNYKPYIIIYSKEHTARVSHLH